MELYGGVVEKFIGDAVMAVWGTPVTQEDDAERAVRAALDLTAAVSALGDEVGAPELRARAGVLTGEAAVNLGAHGEGMVAGDLVNAAARIQAAADPGTVLVGEATRRASEQAIAFEEAGEHQLKGKAEPLSLYRAVRVTAARGGALRSEGLEAPFVGRERELRLVKELYHASAEQSRAQFVQITGIAGIGKSRLAWEFFKYTDGLVENIWWHRGRCLAYGEGVAYWALAEMVRTRAKILEGEPQDVAREKLAASLAEHVPDAEERALDRAPAGQPARPRRPRGYRPPGSVRGLAPLLRAPGRPGTADMVFEDLHWADQALLAFIEYLLEWSASQRLYVVALARPEIADQYPDFARGVRNSTSLALEPLSDAEMTALLDGYVPGLPNDLTARVLARAQGVPLYAVETVRMLLDRSLLVRDGPVYRPTGEVATLEVPETLHALAAARLDGLPAEERQLVQQACVLGKAFTKQALAALTDRPERDLESLLAGLVRKEVLSLHADPRWPERGQYGFLQELLRQVAYETLSRRDRKSRHLAAVSALELTFEGADQEVPEVIASHLLAACEAAPDDPDAPEIRERARAALAQAGERAAALAAPEEAQRYLDQAAALAANDRLIAAGLLERAGTLALQAGDSAGARERLEQAIDLYDREATAPAAARAGVALADVDLAEGSLEEGIRRLEAALSTLEEEGVSAELADTYASLGRLQILRGDPEAGAVTLERALHLAEALALDETFVQALTSKAVVLMREGRHAEARILLEGAVGRAPTRDHYHGWWRSANNLTQALLHSDRYAEALALSDDIQARARQRGDREQLAFQLGGAIPMLAALGRWQEALDHSVETAQLQASPYARSEAIEAVPILCEQGRIDAAKALLLENEWQRNAEQAEAGAGFASVETRLLRAQNRPAEALAAAERGLAYINQVGLTNYYMKRCLIEAVEAALDLDDLAKSDDVLSTIDDLLPGQRPPLLEAHRARFHARLDGRQGIHDRVEHNFRSAETLFAEYGLVFPRAATQLEHAEWLVSQGRSDEAGLLLGEARVTFEQLEARPWLDRVDAVPAATRTTGIPA